MTAIAIDGAGLRTSAGGTAMNAEMTASVTPTQPTKRRVASCFA